MNEITKHEPTHQAVSIFVNGERFDHAQRIAKVLASSGLVPTNYQGNIADTMVALEMAGRVNASPLMVMQNLHVIHGRPSWSSQFVIAALNSCGRFKPLRFRIKELGEKTVSGTKINDKSCVAWTYDADGELLEGPAVTIEMAVLEGWYKRSGSKWPTMPDIMLRYRAAKFFGNLYAPDVMMGMQTQEELVDIGAAPSTAFERTRPEIYDEAVVVETISSPIESLNAQILSGQPPAPDHEIVKEPAGKDVPKSKRGRSTSATEPETVAPAAPAANDAVSPSPGDEDLI